MLAVLDLDMNFSLHFVKEYQYRSLIFCEENNFIMQVNITVCLCMVHN